MGLSLVIVRSGADLYARRLYALGDFMTTFDERGQGFEKKFALDAEQEFKASARRNRLLGEWAAELMGLENPAEYAKAVVKSDFEQPTQLSFMRVVPGRGNRLARIGPAKEKSRLERRCRWHPQVHLVL